MVQVSNVILLIIVACIAVVFVYVFLSGSCDNFNDVLSPKKQAMSDVSKYMAYNVDNYNKIQCNNFLQNAEQRRYPELNCTQNNYYQYAKLGGQIASYVSAEDSSIEKSLTIDENNIMILNKDRDAYINRPYVIDFLEYINANPPAISAGTAELFGSVPTVAKPDTFANTTLLFPTDPGDFYGNYEVDRGQFVLLDGIKLHLDYSYLGIKDVDDNYLIKFQINEIKKVDFNAMPTTTIIITFNSFNKNSKISTAKVSEKLNKLNLLKDIGLDGNIIYLYGNNGVYRMYNYYKSLIFKLNRLTQE
jgi:hypothetical protein